MRGVLTFVRYCIWYIVLCVHADCNPLYFPARLHHSYEGIRWSKKKLKPACEARHHGHTFSLFATQGSVLFSGCATSLLASLSAFSYDSITANSLSSGEARGANGSGLAFSAIAPLAIWSEHSVAAVIVICRLENGSLPAFSLSFTLK